MADTQRVVVIRRVHRRLRETFSQTATWLIAWDCRPKIASARRWHTREAVEQVKNETQTTSMNTDARKGLQRFKLIAALL